MKRVHRITRILVRLFVFGMASVWTTSLFAESVRLPEGFQVRLSALAGGLRFLPDPGERSYLNEDEDATDGSSRFDANEFGQDETVPEPPTRRQARWQSFGLVLKAGEGSPGPASSGDLSGAHGGEPGFFYRAELGLFFQEGGDELTADDDASRTERRSYTRSEESAEAPGLRLYPGNDLFIGFRTGDGLNLALGRQGPAAAWQDNLLGGHGPLTGLHLGLANEYASVRVSPYHRHALAGNFIPREGDPALLHRMGRRRETDLRNLSRGSESYGQRIDFIGRLGLLRVGLNYAANHQNETARLQNSTEAIDRVEYTGGGIGLGRTDAERAWEVYLHGERSLGFTRSLGRNLDGDKTRRIDGRALRAGGSYRDERFHFELRLFLPEPADLPRTGNAGKSGYVGYGDSPPLTPLLSGTLNSRPAPALCPDRDQCEGLLERRELPGFAAHAGVAELSLGWRGERVLIDFDAALLRPIAPRTANEADPFARTRADENGSAYVEVALAAGWRFPDGRLRLQYARLIGQREQSGAARLAGEALYLTMEYDL